ncbi:MAG TPA: Rne/Rng family ribonuclease [Bryobacteraceae bacterium]|nr:Rne/Rng family ribonuclease [Bryobacteraceae bacterium]
MSKELVISSNRHETKVALLEDDQLVEVYFQRSNEYSLAGSIHKGRVTRVLPGMQSAFVDLGLERDTFLYVSDFLEEHEDFDTVTGDERPVREDRPVRENRQAREDRPRGEHQRRDHRNEQRGDYRRSQPPRPVAEAQPAPVGDASAAPVAGGAAEPISSEPRAADASGPAAGSAASPGPDRGGERDRRGRRSRRRRRGGRGFPEAKYAGEGAPPVVEAPVAAAEVAALMEASGEVPAEAVAPIILPGESLRKYKGPPAGVHREDVLAPSGALETSKAGAAEDQNGNEYDEPIHYPPENALPDAPIHEQILEEAAAEERAAPVITTPEAVVTDSAVSLAAGAGEAEETAADADGSAEEDTEELDDEPAVAPLLDEDEDRDIQAMILGDVEGIEIEELENRGVESGGSRESAAEGAGGQGPSGDVQPESGSAEVRERGGRFPHRVSRRTRRRGRGPDSRGGPETRGPEGRGLETRLQETRGQEGRDVRTVSRPNTQPISIADLLKEGQEIIVQIAKEPLGQKGARITSHIALPGRYVVYMPTLEHMGVSRKIASDEERLRLKRILQAQRPGPAGGFITRTAAAGRTEEEIAGDMQFLYNLWQDIKTKADKQPAPVLLHHDLDIVQRILRDQLADNFKAIWIDNEVAYEGVLRFVERFQPALVPKVKLYTREIPIFDAFNITSELEKALRPKVWLKSGGYIVINQTEALVAVDVNTGKFVGKSNRLEDTIVKTNTEAIKEIVRQIRLRDLGGIIVIDFIDMDERKNRQKVMQALEEAMRVDRAPYKILQFNDFGLVAITRKRVKQSLERTLCSLCPHCEGAGYIKSVQTVVSEILTEARKMAKSVEGKDVMLRVHPDVAKVLKSHQNKYLEELEEILRRPVLVKGDAQLHHEKFDLA